MICFDRGLFKLDDKVLKYIPQFAQNGKGNITIRNLLLHNSGLPAFKQYYKMFDNGEDVLNDIYSTKLDYPTGTKTVYSDLGIITLGKIIEKVTGMKPDKVGLKEIILSDQQTVAKVKALLVAGNSFDNLARAWSVNKNTSVFGGDMGYISYNELGQYSEKVKDLKPGEWTGPLKKGPLFFFLKCTGHQPARLKTFEEAKDEIVTRYRIMKFDTALQDRIDQIKSYTPVAAYPKKLRDLKYN